MGIVGLFRLDAFSIIQPTVSKTLKEYFVFRCLELVTLTFNLLIIECDYTVPFAMFVGYFSPVISPTDDSK